MKLSYSVVAICITALSTSLAYAETVDLTGWTAEGQGTWNVSPEGDSVTQTVNGLPTVFYSQGTLAQGTELSGQIRDRGGDDDYIGFVLGYDAGELESSDADFWLVDWKQATQPFYGTTAEVGLALSHVTGDLSNATITTDFWGHVGTVEEVQRASTLGSTGYQNDIFYEFAITFTDTLIEVFVDGNLEISLSGIFEDGSFGFYNFSQDPVDYVGITSAVVQPSDPNVIPLPAGLPLLLGGLGMFGVIATRKRSS